MILPFYCNYKNCNGTEFTIELHIVQNKIDALLFTCKKCGNLLGTTTKQQPEPELEIIGRKNPIETRCFLEKIEEKDRKKNG